MYSPDVLPNASGKASATPGAALRSAEAKGQKKMRLGVKTMMRVGVKEQLGVLDSNSKEVRVVSVHSPTCYAGSPYPQWLTHGQIDSDR